MDNTDKIIKNLIRQACDLLVSIKKVREADYVNDAKNFNYLTERLQMLSEKFACGVRKLAIDTYAVERCMVYDNTAEVLGIEIYKENNSVVIELPFLLPRKKDKQAKFVGDPLKVMFERLSEHEDFKIKEKAVICIVHVYDNKHKKARCYDFDNLESKRILDIITVYTLKDDSPEYCDVYHTSMLSDTDKTKIIVMPISEFQRLNNPYIFE